MRKEIEENNCVHMFSPLPSITLIPEDILQQSIQLWYSIILYHGTALVCDDWIPVST